MYRVVVRYPETASLVNTKKVFKIAPILPDWSFDGKNSTEREPKKCGLSS